MLGGISSQQKHAEYPKRKPSLHWLGVVWVVGHFIIAINLFSSIGWFFTHIKPTFYHYMAVFLYGPLAIASAIAMLINRRAGWILALLTLAASTVYFAPAALGYTPPGLSIFKQYLFQLSVIAFTVNCFWFVYFIYNKHRYGFKETGLKLAWPGFFWVVAHFGIGIYLLFLLLRGIVLEPTLRWLWEYESAISLYRILFNVVRFIYLSLALASAAFLLANRRVGWVLAIATLAASTGYFAAYYYPAYPYWTFWLIISFVVASNTTWLVYFLVNRRRYLKRD